MTLAPPESWHFRWAHGLTGYSPRPDVVGVSAVNRRGKLMGLVLFDGWTPAAASMHVALAERYAPRSLLREAFHFLFVTCGRTLARGEVRGSNTRVLALALHLGFRQVYEVPNGWAWGESLVLLEMRREECRWIQEVPHG